MTTIGNMTLEQLKTLIDQRLQARLATLFGASDLDEAAALDEEPDPRPLTEIFESIDQHMWAPPPGAKSSLELLREDRDR